MDNSIKKYIKTYATYSDLFSAKYDKNKLIRFIEELPLEGILEVLSQLTGFNFDNKKIRKEFYDFLDSIDAKILANYSENIKLRLDEHFLYSPQGLLSVWKWLLAYGRKSNSNKEVGIHKGIMIVLYLCLITSDYLYDEERSDSNSLVYEMFRNAVFNSSDNPMSIISRTYKIFIEIAKNKPFFNEKEYVDFNDDFKNQYGYTIEEYLAVIFGIYASFPRTIEEIEPRWRKPVDKLFQRTALSKLSEGILNPLLMDIEEASRWCKEHIDEPWNYLLFKEKPLFLLPGRQMLVISPTILFEHLYEGLFFKIRNCYEQSDTSFLRFLGRPFEIYAMSLLKEGVSVSRIPYIIVPEFYYGKGNGKRSPDLMILLNNKLLVIEVKSRRLRLDSIIGSDDTIIQQDIKDMVIDPLKQAHDRIKEIIDLNLRPEINDVEEIYLMIVNMGNFPTLAPIELNINDELRSYFKIPIKHYFHLDIEELEYLSELISRKHAKPVFKVLDNKASNFSNMPFKNFLLQSSLRGRLPGSVLKNGDFVMKKLHQILFPKEIVE